MATDPSILTRLGYDGTDLKKGLREAREDMARYKAQATLAEGQIAKDRAKFAEQYSRQNRKTAEERIAQIRSDLAREIGSLSRLRGVQEQAARARIAELRQEFNERTKFLTSYDTERTKLAALANQQRQFVQQARQAQAAAGILRAQGGVGGSLGIAREFTATGVLQALGIGIGATTAPLLLREIGRAAVDASIGTGKLAQEIDHVSQKTGIANRDLLVFRAIGKTVGVELQDIVVATRQFSRAIIGGADSLGETAGKGAKVLEALGIKTQTAAGQLRGAKDVLLDVAAAFQQLPDGPEKSAAAIELFGRSGLNLIPFLNLGRDGVREFLTAIEEFIPNLDTTRSLFEQLEKEQAKFDLAMLGLKSTLAEELLPVLIQVVANFAALAKIKAEDGSIIEQLLTGRSDAPGLSKPLDRLARALGFKNPQVAAGAQAQFTNELAGLASERAVGLPIIPLRNRVEQGREIARARGIKTQVTDEQALLLLLVAEGKIREGNIDQEKKLTDETKDRLDAIRRVVAAGKEEAEQKRIAKQIEEERAQIARDQANRAREAIIQRNFQQFGESGVDIVRFVTLQSELIRLRREETNLSGGELLKNLQRQQEITRQLVALSGALAKSKRDEKEAQRETTRLLEEANRAARGTLPSGVPDVLPSSLTGSRLAGGPAAPSQLREFFAGLREFGDIVSRFDASLNRTLGQLFAVIEGFGTLIKQMQVLGGATRNPVTGQLEGGAGFFGGIGRLFRRGSGVGAGQRLSGLLGLVGTGIGAGTLLSGLLGGAFGRGGNGFTGALGGAALGAGGIGLLGGLLVAGQGGAFGAGALAAALSPVGLLAGAGLAAFFGIRGAQQKKTRKIAREVQEEIKSVLSAFNEGRTNLKDTISQLEQERADAIRRLSGRKGGQKELQPILAEIDKQLSDLRARQRQIIEDFQGRLGILRVPEGARDAAEAIQQIAKALKAAADAGATAAEQIEFLNRSLDDLKLKIGRDLRDEEQETLDLLLRQVELQKEREKIIKQAADAEAAARRSGGLERALTPGQQAALEIRRIREQRDEQLQALDEEAERIAAQLEGRAELFELSVAGLELDEARRLILDRQLELERQITLEVIARIEAQRALLADLNLGQLPQLPAGVLPSGFTLPGGSTYIINGATIQVVLPSGSSFTPEDAADIVRRGLDELGAQRADFV